jgi:hypothetical protein
MRGAAFYLAFPVLLAMMACAPSFFTPPSRPVSRRAQGPLPLVVPEPAGHPDK